MREVNEEEVELVQQIQPLELLPGRGEARGEPGEEPGTARLLDTPQVTRSRADGLIRSLQAHPPEVGVQTNGCSTHSWSVATRFGGNQDNTKRFRSADVAPARLPQTGTR